MNQKMTIQFILCGILLLFVVACNETTNKSISNKSESLNSNSQREYSIEEKMVFLDGDHETLPDKIDVSRVRYLLDYHASRCSNSREEIAETVSNSVDRIQNGIGRRITRQQFLEISREQLDSFMKSKKIPKDKDGKLNFNLVAAGIALSIK